MVLPTVLSIYVIPNTKDPMGGWLPSPSRDQKKKKKKKKKKIFVFCNFFENFENSKWPPFWARQNFLKIEKTTPQRYPGGQKFRRNSSI